MDQPGVAENPPTSLRVAFLGAASVPVEILRRVGSVLGIRRVINAYPAEIEDLLLKIGSLSAVSVVGVPDPQRGESAVAFVVPSNGRQVDEPEVIAWARQNLAGYKVPRRVFVRDSLPLNPNGKVMKDALRREAADSLIPDAIAGR
jgi:acyl-CoA synthetase (AMP-forming)/AMP-acid ligase II